MSQVQLVFSVGKDKGQRGQLVVPGLVSGLAGIQTQTVNSRAHVYSG